MSNLEQLVENTDAVDSQLQMLLSEAYPARELSTRLRQRITDRAAQHELRTLRRARRRRSLRTGIGLAGAVLALVMLIVEWPTLVAAQALRRMAAAVTDVRSAHFVAWRIADDGTRTKESETWYQNGQWRIEQRHPNRTQVFTAGRLWSYEPEAAKVTVRRREGPFSYNPSGFTLSSMMSDYTRWGWTDKISMLDNTMVHGRSARQVSLEHNNGMEMDRSLLLVDAATDLPLRCDTTVRSNDGRGLRVVTEFDFNGPLMAALFEPRFPRSAHVFDSDRGQEEWRQKLAKGIARQRVGDRSIVIRDLQVNAEGNVFLLFTAGKYLSDEFNSDWRVSIQDDRGTTYQRPNAFFLPTMSRPHPGLPNGYVFGKERLEGDWWTPIEPQRPWQPRRFTVIYHVNSRNVHGSLPEQRTLDYAVTASFTIPVQRPACSVVPDYMPYMATGLYPEIDVLRANARARAYYYHICANQPRQALPYYQEVRRLNAELAHSYGYSSSEDWHLTLDIADALGHSGRKAEARAEIERTINAPTGARDEWTRWSEIAGVYKNLGFKAEARAMYDRAITECPYPQQQEWMRKRRDELR